MSNTIAMIVSDANKISVQTAVNALTPEYTIEFVRKCAPLDPEMNWDQAPSHWYMSASAVPDEALTEWQAAAPSLDVVLFIAINAINPLDWAYSNLASQGLQFVPDPI